MHLKNFSLYKPQGYGYILSPAYDLLSTQLVLPEDTEELALNLNGKKRKIRKVDFEIAMKNSNIDKKAIANIFKKFKRTIPLWEEMIDKSFLSNEIKTKYKIIIAEKSNLIFE